MSVTPVFFPREPRTSCALYGWLLLADDRLLPIFIGNLSAGGCMGEIDDSVRPSTAVGVSIPNAGVFPGKVRWARYGRVGISFRRRLPVHVFDELIEAAGRCAKRDMLLANP